MYEKCTYFLNGANALNGSVSFVNMTSETKKKAIRQVSWNVKDQSVKMIYFDIDGTLREENSEITEKTKYAIRECKRQGILTCICTGRNMSSIQKDVQELQMDGTISGGGASIRYRGQELDRKTFPDKWLEEVRRLTKKEQIGLVLETQKNVYMDQRAAEIYQQLFKEKTKDCTEEERERIKRKNKYLYKNNMTEYDLNQEKTHKICIVGSRDLINEIRHQIESGCEIVQSVPFGKKWLLECLPTGCNKGNAVRYLNQQLGIEKAASMSFGDGENDAELLLATGTGIAMENGSAELKKIADAVCGTVQEDGIYKELVNREIIKER